SSVAATSINPPLLSTSKSSENEHVAGTDGPATQIQLLHRKLSPTDRFGLEPQPGSRSPVNLIRGMCHR
ncbi:MAG: hypothetical protein ACK57P_08255, partial [Planctomycetota bacterium]